MRFEAESLADIAAVLFSKAKSAEEKREKERTVRGKLYLRAEANAYTDAAQLVRDTVIVPKKDKPKGEKK